MAKRSSMHPCLPFGLVLTSLLLSGCIVRVRSQDGAAATGEDTITSSGSTAASASGPSSTSTRSGTLPGSGASSSSSPSSSGPATSSALTTTSSKEASSTSSSNESSDTPQDPLLTLDQNVARYVENYLAGDELLRMRGDLIVAHKDKIVSSYSYHEPAGQRYAYGSITKTMTAVAILQLEQAGKLKRSDTLRTFIPELPDSFDAITIDQLLSHRSGLGDYLDDTGFLDLLPTEQSRAQMIARIAKEPPAFSPGSDTSYSNSGYFLLGVVIERSSKQSLSGYFESYIFGPAKMTDASLWDDNIATGHFPDGGQITKSPRFHPSITFAAGAACGTKQDLIAFGRALVDGTLLPKALVQQLIEPKAEIDNTPYGLGIVSVELANGQRMIGHSGRTLGHNTSWYMTSDGTWSSVVLSNLSSVETNVIALDTLKMAITGKYVEPPKALPFDPAIAKLMAGTYELDPAQVPALEESLGAEIVAQIKQLQWRGDTQYLVKPIGQPEFSVHQVAKDHFYSQAGQITLKARRQGASKILGLNLIQGPLNLSYLRLP